MIWVADLERSLAFYEKTLSIMVDSREPRFTTLKMSGTYELSAEAAKAVLLPIKRKNIGLARNMQILALRMK